MKKVVINTCFGGFTLSEAAYAELGMEWDGYGFPFDAEGKRDDPKLIAAIEKLGTEAASGYCARLKIVEIPDDVEWYIHDYDGVEAVHEQHRSWD